MIAVVDFLSRLQKVRKQRGYWVACCPSHDDRSPSMSIRDMGDGIAVKCFSTEGSCTTDQIAQAVGLSKSDLLADRDDKAKILDTYPYHGPDGELLFEVVRYVPKSFKQRRPVGNDKWEWNLKGVDRVPYRLPELRDGIDTGKWVFLVEGEKDVARLEAEGVTATTTPGGAGNWTDNYAQWFAGGLVAVIGDNDPHGEEYAAHAAEAISRFAREVRVVSLDDLKPKGDVSDWLRTHTIDDLKERVRTTPAWNQGEPTPAVTSSPTSITMTWPDSHVEAAVAKLTWQGGQVHGEVSIRWMERTLIEYQRVNTQSASARRDLVTELNRYDRDMAWHDILAQLFAGAVRQYRTVERLEDMRHKPPAQAPSFLIGDYWPDMARPSLIFGDGESAKSTISLALLLSAVSGQALIPGGQPYRRGPAAFIDYEDDADLFNYRLQLMARSADINLDDCDPIYYHRPRAALYQVSDALGSQLNKQGVLAVVIDSRSGAQSGSLVNDDDTRTFIDAVLELGVRSWIIDHLDKESTRQKRPAKHSYGSVFLRNRVVSSWFVKANHRTKTQTTVTLTDAKWNHGPTRDERTLVVDWSEGVRIDRRATIPSPNTDTRADQLIGWLYENGPVPTQSDMVTGTGIDKGSVSKIVRDNAGLIRHTPVGWMVTIDDEPDGW